MENPVDKDVRTTAQFKSELRDLCRKEDTSVSMLLRGFVEEYAAGLDGRKKRRSEPEQSRLRFVVDQKDWAAAIERARLENTTISEVIRLKAEEKLAL